MDTENVQIVKEIFINLVGIIPNHVMLTSRAEGLKPDKKKLDEMFHWSYQYVKNAIADQVPDPAPDNS